MTREKNTMQTTTPTRSGAAIDSAIRQAEAMLTYYRAAKKAPSKVLPFRTRAAAEKGRTS